MYLVLVHSINVHQYLEYERTASPHIQPSALLGAVCGSGKEKKIQRSVVFIVFQKVYCYLFYHSSPKYSIVALHFKRRTMYIVV